MAALTDLTPTKDVPRDRPAAAGLGVVVAIGMVALAVVGIHDLAVDRGWARGSAWIPPVVDGFDAWSAGTAATVLGGVAVVLGLVVVLLSLRRGRVSHVAASGGRDLWLSRGASAALLQATADRQSGVVSARATATRRRIDVTVVARGPVADVESRVRSALDARTVTDQRVDLTVKEAGS